MKGQQDQQPGTLEDVHPEERQVVVRRWLNQNGGAEDGL